MSDGGVPESEPEKQWYEAEDPEPFVSKYRIIAVVVFVALFLIYVGMPLYDPLIFVYVVTVFSVFGIICGLMNRELVRNLRGNR